MLILSIFYFWIVELDEIKIKILRQNKKVET